MIYNDFYDNNSDAFDVRDYSVAMHLYENCRKRNVMFFDGRVVVEGNNLCSAEIGDKIVVILNDNSLKIYRNGTLVVDTSRQYKLYDVQPVIVPILPEEVMIDSGLYCYDSDEGMWVPPITNDYESWLENTGNQYELNSDGAPLGGYTCSTLVGHYVGYNEIDVTALLDDGDATHSVSNDGVWDATQMAWLFTNDWDFNDGCWYEVHGPSGLIERYIDLPNPIDVGAVLGGEYYLVAVQEECYSTSGAVMVVEESGVPIPVTEVKVYPVAGGKFQVMWKYSGTCTTFGIKNDVDSNVINVSYYSNENWYSVITPAFTDGTTVTFKVLVDGVETLVSGYATADAVGPVVDFIDFSINEL